MPKCFLCHNHITTQQTVLAQIEKVPELNTLHPSKKMTVLVCNNCKCLQQVIKYKNPTPWVNNPKFKSSYGRSSNCENSIEGKTHE